MYKRQHLTWEIVRVNRHKAWDWDYVSENPNITWEIVRDNPTQPWNISSLARNPSITWDIIQHHLIPRFNSAIETRISKDSDIPGVFHDSDDIWFDIVKNPNVTWDILLDNFDNIYAAIMTWVCEKNTNINWDIVRKYPDGHPKLKGNIWCIYSLLCNPMQATKYQWLKQHRIKIIKTLQIQRYWRRCSCNPKYKLARRLLNKLYKSLTIFFSETYTISNRKYY